MIISKKNITPFDSITMKEIEEGLVIADGEKTKLVEKTITSDGRYNAKDDGVDGYSKLKVNTHPYDPDIDGFVKLIDFDGNIIAEYTPDDFLELTEYPAPPVHEGLTFNGYNWTLEDAQEYVRDYRFQVIGATYVPTDGKSHFFVTFERGEARIIKIILDLLNMESSFTVEWGDGESDTVEPIGSAGTYVATHLYNSLGSYEIKISTTGEVSARAPILQLDSNGTLDEIARDDYSHCLRKVYLANIPITSSGVLSPHIGLSEIILSSMPIIQSGTFAYTSLKTLIIPRDTTTIKSGAINYMPSYCYLSLPKSVISIEGGAIGLNTDTICVPNSNISIQGSFINPVNGVFWYKQIILPDTIINLDSAAIPVTSNAPKLVYIRFPESTSTYQSINTNTFKNCASLRKINLPKGLQYLYTSAFEGCSSLEFIEIPSSVTFFGEKVFKNCSSLKEVEMKDREEEEDLVIYSEAFSGCSSLIKVKLPKRVKISQNVSYNSMFKDCSSLQTVLLPDSISNGPTTSMFQNCSSLKKVKMPSGILSLGAYAFDGCWSLEELEIGNDLKQIGANCFNNCYSLKKINSNTIGVANLPSELEQIEEYAFKSCKLLTDINISNALRGIGQYAFMSSGLVNIDGNKLGGIANGLFYGTAITQIILNQCPKEIVYLCSYLREATISGSPTTIGESAFKSSGILSLDIPASVTSLGKSALADCSSLTSLKFLGTTPPTATSSSFTSLPNSCVIYVPEGSLSAYTSQSYYPSSSTYTYREYTPE